MQSKLRALNKNMSNVNKSLVGFIKNAAEKNYAVANKYLQSVVNEKLKVKIRQAIKTQRAI